MKHYTVFILLLLPIFGISQALTESTSIIITKIWSQAPTGYTYPMDIYVPTGAVPDDGFPVCITLHGNGGIGNVNAWKNTLPNHIIVAPSGYDRSWNIADENSNAPDVEMVSDLIDLLQTYSNVNENKIRVLGTSNGAALANRIFIENNDTSVDIICAIVSHLSDASYHNDGFYYPSGTTGDPAPFEGYDTPITPLTGRKYLNISNTDDGVIPYYGGTSGVAGTSFLDARVAAHIIAQSQGFTGTQTMDSTLVAGADVVYEFKYLGGQVVHLNGEAMHGTNFTQKNYITAFFNSESPVKGALANDTEINITKIWSQEPGGYTYPLAIHVPTSAVPEGGFPVCITLHGNGGQGNVLPWRNVLPNHIIVAPSGYERSWNIADEDSDAPDVEMVGDLIDSLQTFTNVNPNKIRLLGTSNGAALANRVFIENNDTGLDIICAIVSHLTDASYHNGGFYYPSSTTGDPAAFEGYDTPIVPITGRRYLNISNTNDLVIPYFGGTSIVGTTFLDARVAVHIIAQSQGFTGAQTTDSTLVTGDQVVHEFDYLDGQVVHLQGDANHSTNSTETDYVFEYFNREIVIAPTCVTDLNLSTAVTTNTYQASNKITCNSTLVGNATVVFEANSIQLTDGFVAEANTTFTARIAPCSSFQQAISARTQWSELANTELAVQKEKNTFKIFPNPSKAIIRLQGNLNKFLNYSIHTIQGQKVYKGQLSGYNQAIDISNLPTNIYFLRVNNQTFKFVKID